MFVISQPNFEILDERFFTVFVRWFMLGIDHTPYQLPGLSFIVAPFVYMFGDNWFSWRFPIILFGMIFLYFYYKVIENISNKKIALLTTVILSLSPMIFVHSSLMLRDIPVMALGFMAIYLYLKQKYYFSALIIGLSALIKETAFFFVIFITLHYILTNREKIIMQVSSSLDKRCFGFIKTPLFTILILSASFLIPLTIYDNTINVLEYQTVKPELRTWDEDGKFMGMRFNITESNIELYKKPLNDFNYMNKIKDPFHHLQIFIFKGYYSNKEIEDKNENLKASFLPIAPTSTKTVFSYDSLYKQVHLINNIEYHQNTFSFLWDQSMINYSWWHVGFWSCIILIGYTTFQRIKNKIPISKNIIFIFCGLTFFAPYLIIEMIRDTYAYYMIYFLPIMALGLITMIYRIQNKNLRILVFAGFLLAIIINFIYSFPIKF